MSGVWDCALHWWIFITQAASIRQIACLVHLCELVISWQTVLIKNQHVLDQCAIPMPLPVMMTSHRKLVRRLRGIWIMSVHFWCSIVCVFGVILILLLLQFTSSSMCMCACVRACTSDSIRSGPFFKYTLLKLLNCLQSYKYMFPLSIFLLFMHSYHCTCMKWLPRSDTVVNIRVCIQTFPDWPPGARTANGTTLCH